MKFRNKKTGEILDPREAVVLHCEGRLCCDCLLSPFVPHNAGCVGWSEENPREAAAALDCEVIDDDPPLTEPSTRNTIKIKLEENAIMPTRAHDVDAGLDLYATYSQVVPGFGSAVFDTGVHVEIPVGYAGMIKSKSGLNIKHNLTSEGVVDAGYTGTIFVKLYNHCSAAYIVQKGDKISQLVIVPVITPKLEVVDELEETERGTGGFGSTGR